MKANEEKSFKYGGYTFVPLGRFTSFGIKANTDMKKIMKYLYFINRGYVADGHEEYRYDDFYKAAGEDCKADVFLCKETAEMYVPCENALPIFDKTAKDAKEVQWRFDHRKEPCPINNGADLNSDAMLEALFDDGQYIEHQEGRSYKVLGFISGYPMMVDYSLGRASMAVTSYLNPHFNLSTLIKERLNNDQTEVEVEQNYGYATVRFYYTPAYVVKNFLPKD